MPSRDLEAGHVRQAEVEDHRLDPRRRLDELERGPAVRGDLHDVAIVLEQAAQDALEARVILDEQQVHGMDRRSPYGTTVMSLAVGPVTLPSSPPAPAHAVKSIRTRTLPPATTARELASVWAW